MVSTDRDIGNSRSLGLKERLLFGTRRRDLESLVGVSLAEFGKVQEVTLPESVSVFAHNSVAEAGDDFRERWAHFSFSGEDGQSTVDSQGLGEEPTLTKTGLRVVGVKQSMSEALRQRASAKPTLILFHNHPFITPEFVKRPGHPTVMLKDTPLTAEQAATVLSLNASVFSKNDLLTFEGNTRLIRSLLLASPAGYKWIINPNFQVQLPTIIKRSSADSYGEILGQLLTTTVGRMVAQGAGRVDLGQYQDKLDQLLTSYCNNSGFALFANRDIQNPTLRRINPPTN